MNPIDDLDFSKLFSGFYRHKGLVFAVSLVVFLLAVYLASTLPNTYRSSTLILITPRRISGNIVASTITTSVADRIRSISQEILSRTRLESIIKEFGLYPGNGVTMEDRAENFRGNIKLDSRRNDAFQISFDSGNPETAMKVANRLASLFIEQNLQVREEQAIGTTNFINSEAERLRKELEEQETLVSHYRIENRFELPAQLDANLRLIEQMRSELKGNLSTAASMQERLGSLQQQLLEANSPVITVSKTGDTEVKLNLPANQKIQIRQKELDSLLIRYSEKHPDVMRLRSEIAGLEKELDGEKNKAKETGSRGPQYSDNPLKQVIQEQVDSLKSSIKALQASDAELRNSIAVYQKRIDNTPLRGIELTKVSRTYDITLRKYQDLLAKGLESQLSENLEKKQKGEQFQIVDPANLPLAPLKPNRPLILLGGLAAGLLGGLGAAFVWDILDRSLKNGDDLASFVDLPILATIPAILTRGAVLERRRAQGVLGVSTLGALLVGLILVRLLGARFF